MRFYIEFKTPSLNGVRCKEINANNLEDAKKIFATEYPKGQIIKIEGLH